MVSNADEDKWVSFGPNLEEWEQRQIGNATWARLRWCNTGGITASILLPDLRIATVSASSLSVHPDWSRENDPCYAPCGVCTPIRNAVITSNI